MNCFQPARWSGFSVPAERAAIPMNALTDAGDAHARKAFVHLPLLFTFPHVDGTSTRWHLGLASWSRANAAGSLKYWRAAASRQSLERSPQFFATCACAATKAQAFRVPRTQCGRQTRSHRYGILSSWRHPLAPAWFTALASPVRRAAVVDFNRALVSH